MTENASNAVLKAVEEPNERTVFLLCAPSEHPDDVSVTIRSRCRPLRLRTPEPAAIAEVLVARDGVDEQTASWAASVCGGHIGRARRLARDENARNRREAVLAVPRSLRSAAEVFAAADGLVSAAEAEVSALTGERDEAEREELAVSMGGGGTGKGVAQAQRAAKAAEKDLDHAPEAAPDPHAARLARPRAHRPRRLLPRRPRPRVRRRGHGHAPRPGDRGRGRRPRLLARVHPAPPRGGPALPRGPRDEREAADRGGGHGDGAARGLVPQSSTNTRSGIAAVSDTRSPSWVITCESVVRRPATSTGSSSAPWSRSHSRKVPPVSARR